MSADPAVDLRFLQANERTLLAWVRTGLALMAFGFVVARLALWLQMEGGRESKLSLVVGAGIIALGGACQILGAIRFAKARRALIEHRVLVPGVLGPVVIALLVATIGVALLFYLLLL